MYAQKWVHMIMMIGMISAVESNTEQNGTHYGSYDSMC